MKLTTEIFINIFITFLISFLSFFINRSFILYIGIEELGLLKLFSQLLSYLNLIETGVISASTYALYKPLLEKNFKRISIILNTINSLYNKLFIFILVLGILLNPIIPFFINDVTKNNKNIYLYWSIYLISSILNYIFIKYSILFTADQKFGFVRLIQGGSKIFCQLLQILIIIKLQSFLIFIILLILDNIIQYIFYKLYYIKNYSYIFKTKIRDQSITDNLKNIFWYKLSGLIVFNTDLILISKFTSLKIVGIYVNYQMIIQMITAMLNILLNILKPKIGKYIAKNNKENIFKYWKELNILFLFFSTYFLICTYKLINKFIIIWVGKEFTLSKVTVILILINLFVQCFRGITDVFKEGSGFFDDIHLPISEAGINFILSITLVQYFGLNGVIIGTIVSNILIICIAKPILVFKRCFDKGIKDYIEIYGNYLILIIVSLLSCNFILKFVSLKNVNSWFNWIVNGVIVGSITFIITFIVFLSNKDFRDNLFFLKKKEN